MAGTPPAELERSTVPQNQALILQAVVADNFYAAIIDRRVTRALS
jgi:hypothetical protein